MSHPQHQILAQHQHSQQYFHFEYPPAGANYLNHGRGAMYTGQHGGWAQNQINFRPYQNLRGHHRGLNGFVPNGGTHRNFANRVPGRQYMMQVNGVQVSPLPNPTTLVFQGHFTAIEASAQAAILNPSQNPLRNTWAPRDNQAILNGEDWRKSGQYNRKKQTSSVNLHKTNTKKGEVAESVSKHENQALLTPPSGKKQQNLKQNFSQSSSSPAGQRQTAITNVSEANSETLLPDLEYNPSCMYSKASSKSDVKLPIDVYPRLATAMDITSRTDTQPLTNNNNVGKMGLDDIPTVSDLPNIGSFLEYLEEI